MAILFMDGCDHQDEAAGYTQNYKWDKWNSISSHSATKGRFGTGAISMRNVVSTASIYSSFKVISPTELTTLFCNMFIKTDTGSNTIWSGFSYNSTSGCQVTIYVALDGSIKVCSGLYGQTLLGTSVAGVFKGSGCYIESKVVLNATTGTVDVKVDGVSVLSLTGVNTLAAGGTGATMFYINPGNGLVWLDDIVVYDNSGTENNDWIGDVSIDTIFPNGAGANTDGTPSAGANYECADNTTAVSTDYITMAAELDKDTYAFQDLSISTSDSILAVQSHMLVKKDSSGTRKIRAVTRQSLVDYGGSDIPIGDSYTYQSQLWELNPADSAAWEPADVNGAEFGFEIRGQ